MLCNLHISGSQHSCRPASHPCKWKNAAWTLLQKLPNIDPVMGTQLCLWVFAHFSCVQNVTNMTLDRLQNLCEVNCHHVYFIDPTSMLRVFCGVFHFCRDIHVSFPKWVLNRTSNVVVSNQGLDNDKS